MDKSYDVIIIGTGIAGLFTALNIDKRLKILLISKSSIDKTNSTLAQGGIVSCVSPEVHFKDTMRAGAFYNKEEVLRMVEKESSRNIETLIEYGVEFERDQDGNLKFTREGGHSENTILYSKDATGEEIIRVLNREVQKSTNIELLEDTTVIELIKHANIITGIMVLDKEENIKTYSSKNVVLATGGVGRIYKNTTNRSEITGDGIALAYEIGAIVKDMEFIQFHPTAMYSNDDSRRFLISEAVRGEGAILRNTKGQAFMNKYHELKDLAPRDIVSRSIVKEMQNTKSDFVYLDMTHKNSDYIKDRFPNIYKHCLTKGIDMTKQYIPISPAEHYVMGGITTDLDGKTNIDGLFACGECACTGLHGANRLASNSLLEGIVFGRRVAESINNKKSKEFKDICKVQGIYHTEKNHRSKSELFLEIENTLRNTMTDYVSIVRNKKDLLKALDIVEKLSIKLDSNKAMNKRFFELRNMIKISKLIIESAIKREKSLGVHFIVQDDGGKKVLDRFLIEDTIKQALIEDMNNGDMTSEYLIEDSLNGKAIITAKQDGVVCGLDVSRVAFDIVDNSIEFTKLKSDGERVIKGEDLAVVKGSIKSILKGERVALNFLQRMSGIATKSREISKKVEGFDVRVVDTRKTTPGLRIFEKYAVNIGGCFNHRFNLSDAVMIKDNHIEAVGSIKEAVDKARKNIPHTTKIEVEVKNLEELRQALDSNADIIMLDNMDLDTMKKAVEITQKKAILEASGNIDSESILEVARTGVDIISVGALTHSFNSMDISLNINL